MRTALLAIAILGLGACDSRDAREREDSAARQAGKAAYELREKTREAAKKADQNLRRTGKELRQGWNEAKHEKQSGGKK